MIEIVSKETLFTYNLYHIVKAFFPEAEIRQCVDGEQEPLVKLTVDGGSCFSVAEEPLIGEGVQMEELRQMRKRFVTHKVYEYLSEITGRSLSWGMLTGVRPTKLVMQKLEKGKSENEIIEFLKREYSVSDAKAKLAVEIAEREKRQMECLHTPDGLSLYVGIPFCPSICSYCSFSSSPADQWQERMDAYLDALCREIEATAKMAKGKILDTVYIGGGTPTTLSAGQLDCLLSCIEQNFSMETVREYTVEAGRPDSITKEKLEVIRKYPVTRISINPQTMQQKTLDLVGRKHMAEDVKTIFHLARTLGFDNINMDLIAGLPGESAEDMRDTLAQIEQLGPDSLTIHSLAIKRAAKMGQDAKTKIRMSKEGEKGQKMQDDLQSQPLKTIGSEIGQMVEDGAAAAGRMGLLPYYLYRQKNIAGNFENVGYAKVDKAGIYNILIMEEKQTILACGAGAGTKIVLPEKITLENGKTTNLIRIENVKNITEYISRIDEMIERKGGWLWH